MAADVAPTQRMTAAEYLVWERIQPAKHEYHEGEVFAMAGGSARHNFLSIAVASELRNALRGKGCHVLSSDQRIAASPGDRYVYSDAVVACGGIVSEAGAPDVLMNPSIVVEVLSPTTEAYDRGKKWESYQRLSTLGDYLLVSQTATRIEHFQRDPDGSWHYRVHGAGGTITLARGAPLSVDAIYENAFELEAG
jgi:Uma2 family endonuclease